MHVRSVSILGLLLSGLCFLTGESGGAATPLTAVQVATGLTKPVLVTAPPNDTARIFILEKPGRIRIHTGGSLLATPFLDIATRVESDGSEQGLLGLAFPPDYATTGYFYINYTGNPSGHTVIARGHASFGSNTADPTVETLLVIPQPYTNHNGGMIAFGPKDGMLYIGMGDGGSGGDPQNRAQNPDSLLGKMLRIDVSTAPGYAIPSDNPFVGLPIDSIRPEIWAVGIRNPWRFSFDRENGDLWMADVGQNAWEEINWQAGADKVPKNYGWRLKEGKVCYSPPTGCGSITGLTDPFLVYQHISGRCSITGGYVYRGCAIPDLVGAYFYGDYCSGEIFSIRYNGTVTFDSVAREPELGSAVGSFDLSSFGEDALGELYICGYNSGTVSKIVPNGVASACGTTACCVGSRGNVDGSVDQVVNVADVIELIDHLFISLTPVACFNEANCDASLDGKIDISDLTVLLNHLYTLNDVLPDCL